MAYKKPMNAVCEKSFVPVKISVPKVYICHEGESSTNELLKSASELLSQKGINVYTKNTTGQESAACCGFVACIMPSSPQLTKEQEEDILHCWEKEQRELLVVSSQKNVSYDNLPFELKDVLANPHAFENVEELVAIIAQQIDDSQYNSGPKKREYTIMSVRETEQSKYLIHLPIILAGSKNGQEKVNMRFTGCEKDGKKVVMKKRDCTKLKAKLLLLDETLLESEVQWKEVDKCVDDEEVCYSLQFEIPLDKTFHGDIILEGADQGSFKMEWNH